MIKKEEDPHFAYHHTAEKKSDKTPAADADNIVIQNYVILISSAPKRGGFFLAPVEG